MNLNIGKSAVQPLSAGVGSIVASDGAIGLKVTVWRRYSPERTIIHSTDKEATYFSPDERLLQDVFSWQVREDVWGGFTDTEVAQSLSTRFASAFDPFLPPNQRDFGTFKAVLSELSAAATSPNSYWASSAQQKDTDEDSDASTRVNPLLAFYNQLHWIYEVFKDVPGASITVR